MKVIPVNLDSTKSFELLLVKVINVKHSLSVAVIYRPQRESRGKHFSVADFTSELSDLLDSGVIGTRYIICGDLNCPGDVRGSVGVELGELIHNYNLTQHVHEATCRSGNLLDHVLTPCDSIIIKDIRVKDIGLSDHSLVKFRVACEVNRCDIVHQSFRNWKKLDLNIFRQRVRASSVSTHPASTVEAFTVQMEKDITKILNDLVPVCTSTKRQGRPDGNWLSPEAMAAKQERRRLERLWKATKSESVRINYRKSCRAANKLITESRKVYCSLRVTESSHDSRTLWRTVKTLLHPSSSSLNYQPGLCDTFATYFVSKIAKVKSTVSALKVHLAPNIPEDSDQQLVAGDILDILEPTSVDEVTTLIARLPSKTSPLDIIHISVLKACSDVFAPLIVHLANLSFLEGHFPDQYKIAQVTPLLKKAGMDEGDPANYRPISNLSTISKIVERLCLKRLLPHVINSGNFNPLQSAYRKLHSTETALLKIMDDLYRMVDDRQAAVLIGLDLSAAFDTIDHSVLLKRLRSSFGVSGVALQWVESYLSLRSQYVMVGGERSCTKSLDVGVPQGSVLGPFLFSVYVSPIATVISSFGVQFHQYADDTQLYTAVRSGSDEESIRRLEECSQAVRDWFLENGMLLNPDKSEVLLVGTRAQTQKMKRSGIAVAGSDIKFSVKLKSLGVTLDQSLSLDDHVKNVVKASNFHIRALRHIRPTLNREVANTVACSIISTRIDYCNSLLYGTTAKNIDKLQRVQNALARVVKGVKRRDHIKPVLKELHWLPVAQRLQYKVAVITHKVLSTRQPLYLADVIKEHRPTRQLRSSTQNLLAVRSTNTRLAERAFSTSSAAVWNSLPDKLRSADLNHLLFKKKLKTHLFKEAYCL